MFLSPNDWGNKKASLVSGLYQNPQWVFTKMYGLLYKQK